MRIAIIDADIVGKKRHRFPNLACMKLSSYHKSHGHDVRLLWNYDDLDKFDKVFISKVFTTTPIPHEVLQLPIVYRCMGEVKHEGGTANASSCK